MNRFYDNLINVDVTLRDQFTNKITLNTICQDCMGTCSLQYKQCDKCNGDRFLKIYDFTTYDCVRLPKKVVCDCCEGRGNINSFVGHSKQDTECNTCVNGMRKIVIDFSYDEYFNHETKLTLNGINYNLNFSNVSNKQYETDGHSYFILDKDLDYNLCYVRVVSLNDILNRKTFVFNHIDGTKILIQNKKIINPNKIYIIKDETNNRNLYLKFQVVYPEQEEEIKIEKIDNNKEEEKVDKMFYIEDLATY